MQKFFRRILFSTAFISSLFFVSECQAEISKKKLEQFSYKVEHIFTKLLSSNAKKSSDKMFEYVLEIKKEFERTYRVRLILDDFFDYACERIESTGCVITDQQKAALEKAFKIKRDYNFHYHLSVKKPAKKEENYVIPRPLAYGFSLTLCGILFQATNIPLCLIYGPQIEQMGIEECRKFLIVPVTEVKNDPVLPINELPIEVHNEP